MLSSVLRSDRAADVNVAIMRTFVRLRQVLSTNEELARKVAQHDQKIDILFEHIKGRSSFRLRASRTRAWENEANAA